MWPRWFSRVGEACSLTVIVGIRSPLTTHVRGKYKLRTIAKAVTPRAVNHVRSTPLTFNASTNFLNHVYSTLFTFDASTNFLLSLMCIRHSTFEAVGVRPMVFFAFALAISAAVLTSLRVRTCPHLTPRTPDDSENLRARAKAAERSRTSQRTRISPKGYRVSPKSDGPMARVTNSAAATRLPRTNPAMTPVLRYVRRPNAIPQPPLPQCPSCVISIRVVLVGVRRAVFRVIRFCVSGE